MHDKTFPAGFMCIGLKTFKWVYANRKEFVDFTINEMDKPSGLFLQWQIYCNKQLNESPKTNY